ncbi:RNA polymerase sigma factor [Gynuella sunshinyii]|uniref:Putative RNA polymerase sigma factor containing a TPR repeat domain n=1 Tax=Gynuella sunshinyii YC6258 TaxID=1445510 RepID=A0A0C5VQE9_9GAMM|nr:RNA polymerase sigma factor [Gynuella sunshinyii]AJQ95648.1 putative RNA polymerase sigma factor containing a TPR repeat domain [Gynuella sunshinyii YC6258]
MSASLEQRIAEVYQAESRRVLATLIRLLHGHFDMAEDALQDAFIAALSQWQRDGIPDNPRAWLVSAGRFKAIDQLRKSTRLDSCLEELAQTLEMESQIQSMDADDALEDDQLRLIFTCCHPSLAMESRIALTLREVCGLTTEAIAAAFLLPVPTLAQRIVRAKNKIRDARIPYEVPEPDALPERLEAVLSVVYLVFNEGYSASSGTQVIQGDLATEAIRLTRLLRDLLPNAEVTGLLALMLLHDARRNGRTSVDGDLIPLEEQDRSRWNQSQIREGCDLVIQALKAGPPGVYTLQAAIAAVHAEAPTAAATDWAEITGLYDVLLRQCSSPVVALNRAVALAMRDGPEAGLKAIDAFRNHKELQHYYLLHAARADLFRRLDRSQEAIQCYQQALDLVKQEPERRFLQQRLAMLQKK